MVTQRIQDPDVFHSVINRGLSAFAVDELPRNPDEIDITIGRISELLESAPPPTGAVNAPQIRGQYLSGVGVIYGMMLAQQFDWIFCEVRNDDERAEDGVIATVSPDQSHFVFPIGVVYKEAHRHGDECRKVYEKIKTGNLPDVPVGSFFEVTA